MVGIRTEFSDHDFALIIKSDLCVRGFIDTEMLETLSPEKLLSDMNEFDEKYGGGMPEERKKDLWQRLGKDLPNFLFVNCLMDYGNIGTSESLRLGLLDVYKMNPSLFRPGDDFWRSLDSMEAERAFMILGSQLFRLTGMFRTDFEKVVLPSWWGMMDFLHRECNDDAGNFFLAACRLLGVHHNDPDALNKIECILSRTSSIIRKKKYGMKFAWGPKIGALLLSSMTDNLRGFNFLSGVNREQVKNLKAPVDSAVIRVMLNTGLVKIRYVSSSLKEGRIMRGDMTKVCQETMDEISRRLNLFSIELDHYIWEIGSLVCKHRGRFCFLCPMDSLCESWQHEYVRESSGKDYRERCFSFARPQTARNALYLRGCENCPYSGKCEPLKRGMRFPSFNKTYQVRHIKPSRKRGLLRFLNKR